MTGSVSVQPQAARAAATPASRTGFWLLAGYTILYFLVTVPLAAQKLLWHDELFSVYLGATPRLADVWKVLMTGADGLPPGFHLITRAAFSLHGPVEVIVRAPEILAFWLLGICLFQVTARRTSLLHAAFAGFLPCVMETYRYAFEARPYALMAAFTALALLSWQRLPREVFAKWAPVGFVAGIVGGTSVHYYGGALLLPFAAGEVVYWRREHRFRSVVWFGMAAALVPIALEMPFIRGASAGQQGFWAPVEWLGIPNTYLDLLGKFFPVVVLLAALILVCVSWESRSYAREFATSTTPPLPEIVVVAALAFVPLIIVIFAKLVTHIYTPRYGIEMVVGVCVLLAWGLYHFTGGRRAIALLVLAGATGYFLFNSVRTYRAFVAERRDLAELGRYLSAAQPTNLPVVISDPHLFAQLSHYGPTPLLNRMIYPSDPNLEFRHTGTNTVDLALQGLTPVWPLRITPFGDFLRSTAQFLVYGYPSDWGWQLQELEARGMHLEITGSDQSKFLFRATR